MHDSNNQNYVNKARQGLTVSLLTDPGHIDTIYVVYDHKVSI